MARDQAIRTPYTTHRAKTVPSARREQARPNQAELQAEADAERQAYLDAETARYARGDLTETEASLTETYRARRAWLASKADEAWLAAAEAERELEGRVS